MLKHFILTILSDDKPGIVSELAENISQHGGNWLESRLAQLGGKFAGVVNVAVEMDRAAELIQALSELKTQNIRVTVDELLETPTRSNTVESEFTATGPDRKGIVKEVSLALAALDINVEELETQCSSMPYSGDPLFEAQGRITIPSAANRDDLAEKLAQIGDSLGIDITLKDI